jgi:hypothetical protein
LAHLHRARPRVRRPHRDGRIVATTATLPYGERFAWISMVLVKGDTVVRVLATQLMRRAMDELAREDRIPSSMPRPMGAPSIAGSALKTPGALRGCSAASGNAPPLLVRSGGRHHTSNGRPDWPALCAYDAAAFGAERGAVLAGLRGRPPAAEFVAERAGRIVGFALGRDGGLAAQVGPLIADDPAIAAALLARAVDGLEGPLFVDLADSKQEVRSFLDAPRLHRSAAVHAHAVWVFDALRRRGADLRRHRAGIRVRN